MARSQNINWELPKLDLSVDRYSAFLAWFDRWTDYATVAKLKDEDAEYRCSMLRYNFTEETRKIYNTLGLTEAEAKDDKVIIEKLKTFARVFNSRNQKVSTISLQNLKCCARTVTFVIIVKMGYYEIG